MSVQTVLVSGDEAEIRLDRWFRRHFPQVTQGALQKLCRTGQVRVDGKRAEAATRLAPGQAIRVPPLPAAPPPAPSRPVDPHEAAELQRLILHRDDALLVLNKPPGLPVQGGPGITRHLDGMLDALRLGGERPRLVHRLDRDTSGVLLLARTPGIAGKLAAAFRGRAVKKTYWAVVVGRPAPGEGVIDAALVRSGGARAGHSALAEPGDPEAARAITEYRVLDAAGRRLAWLELAPLTGRTHQLRVHCAALGAPILGDSRYGGGETEPAGFAPLLHLHARALTLPHPAGGTLAVSADLPPHMRETFRTLGFTAPAAPKPARR